MRSKLSWSGLGLLLLALLSLPACAGRDDGKTRLAFVSNNAHDFWTLAEKGVHKAAADLGVSTVFRKPPSGSTEEQQQIVESLLSSGVKGLAVSPNDSANSVEFYRGINKRVPLLMVDSDLPDPTARRAYLGTHNYRAGLAVGELVTKAAPKGGKVAIFVGKLDVQNAIERRQGVLDFLADPDKVKPEMDKKEMGQVTPPDARNLKVGNYTLVVTQTDNNDEATCQDRAREILLQNPDLDVLVGLWEYNPPALLRAVKNANLAKPPVIVGFDENYQTLDGIKSGDVYATVVQNPFEFGYQSMKLLNSLVKGDEAAIKNYPGIDEQNRIFIPHRVINKDNVEPFYEKLKELRGK